MVIDKTRLPMPFDQVQCADLAGWSGDGEHPNWRKVITSVAELAAPASPGPALTPDLPNRRRCARRRRR
jgi:adenylate cyclase